MKVAVLGGGGYVGSSLVPALVRRGWHVTVLDKFWFWDKPFLFMDQIPGSKERLTLIKGDIRNQDDLRLAIKGQDAVIHLACISNDPSFDMDPELGKSINLDAFPTILQAVKGANFVQRFIYASSSSVYGVKAEKNVTEDMSCEPLTDYSKYKLQCEDILHNTDMGDTTWTIVRPATVCGWAPRLRLDLSVNVLTISAIVNKRIVVHGGEQLRPNLNIQDMVQAYLYLLGARDFDIHEETFNVGYQNKSIMDIARMVTNHVSGVEIVREESSDNRSYHVNSDKIKKAIGFVPAETIDDAIKSIINRYNLGFILDSMGDSKYYNLKRLKEHIHAGTI